MSSGILGFLHEVDSFSLPGVSTSVVPLDHIVVFLWGDWVRGAFGFKRDIFTCGSKFVIFNILINRNFQNNAFFELK